MHIQDISLYMCDLASGEKKNYKHLGDQEVMLYE